MSNVIEFPRKTQSTASLSDATDCADEGFFHDQCPGRYSLDVISHNINGMVLIEACIPALALEGILMLLQTS